VTDPTLLFVNGAAPETAPPEPPPRGDHGDEPPEVRALWAAVDRGDVTFHQVATAWFESRFTSGDADSNGRPGDAATREAYGRVFPELLDVFGTQRGSLISAYFCRNIRVGVALTDIESAAEHDDGPVPTLVERREQAARETEWGPWKRFWARRRSSSAGRATNTAIHLEPIFGDPDSPRAKELLFRCLRVHYHALEFLKPKPRKICMRMTFNVITMLLGTLDTRSGHGGKASAFDQNPEDQRTIEKELECTEAYFLQSAQRTARLEYLIGMVPGLLLAALAGFLIWQFDLAPREFSIAVTSGALGALVSVMERLTAGKLTLGHEYGKATLRILGGIRPFIGALFGLALYVLISGALVPMKVPDDAEVQRYFFAGIAFLAGFSERWAQDMIDPGKLSTPTALTTATSPPGARPPAPTLIR
jgi:hypothetical protein